MFYSSHSSSDNDLKRRCSALSLRTFSIIKTRLSANKRHSPWQRRTTPPQTHTHTHTNTQMIAQWQVMREEKRPRISRTSLGAHSGALKKRRTLFTRASRLIHHTHNTQTHLDLYIYIYRKRWLNIQQLITHV